MKTYIDVPFHQHQRAKSLGARFDMALKRWFVPDGFDLERFREWLPAGVDTACWDRLRTKSKNHGS